MDIGNQPYILEEILEIHMDLEVIIQVLCFAKPLIYN